MNIEEYDIMYGMLHCGGDMQPFTQVYYEMTEIIQLITKSTEIIIKRINHT